MTWRINGPERNMPPAEFQDRLTYLGGVNLYDDPNFRIWWSQYAHGDGSFRAGGHWTVDEQHYEGYRSLLTGSGEPCWTLGQWHAAEEYGSPEAYYVFGYDEATGYQTLGEYPYSGRVEVLYNLRWHEMIDGRLTFHTMPLSTTTFDSIVPIILAAKDISVEKRKAAYLAAKELEESAKLRDIERHLIDRNIPFAGGSVSFTRQGIRSTVIDAKMRSMQQRWNQLSRTAATLKPGIQTR